MASVNKVLILGNLVKDPETRHMSNGEAVTNITVATNEKWKSKDGTQHEEVEFHRVTFYRKLAEIAGEFLKKGAPVYIEGKNKTRKWTDKNGVERYTTEIIANEMQMLGSKPADSADSRPANNTPQPSGFEDMDDSDIPPF